MSNVNPKPPCYQKKELTCLLENDPTNCRWVLKCFKVREPEFYRDALDKAIKFRSGVFDTDLI